ncbi:MAG TPA: glycosyltransferase family 4 protein [Alphaproteobacteria bacterium]|nr:glycosyltransferase family 4 protein [Alphaproteobacteria bacterium]
MPERHQRTIGVVVKGWPRLSETFIAQELRALEQRGLRLHLYSLRHPTDRQVHALNHAVAAPVSYLPEYLWHEPLRIWRGWRIARRLPGYARARGTWLRDLRRDLTPNRIRRFGQALVLAAERDPAVAHFYAHFLHTPASVARYAALMTALPWSVSAHAKDIWTTPDWEKGEKLREAVWAVTCTRAGAEHLETLAPGKVSLVYHGLDAERFPSSPVTRPARDGTSATDPLRILSVGRAVPKKGYEDLLAALALLPPDLNWRFVHIGGGPLLHALKQQAAALGLGDRIVWRGAQVEDAVRAAYRDADVFVLASRISGDGDRDGLPNVLLEALSQGCPVIATAVSAIPELVADGVTGSLVPPGDPTALAAAIVRQAHDPALRARLAAAGEARVRRDFPLERGIECIAELLQASVRREDAVVSREVRVAEQS